MILSFMVIKNCLILIRKAPAKRAPSKMERANNYLRISKKFNLVGAPGLEPGLHAPHAWMLANYTMPRLP